MEPEETKRFAEGLFQQMQIITDYCKDLKDKFDAILQKSDRETTIYGIFLRALCLMKTLCKCNEASDFQTILHANRTLMETAVDVIFLLHDETGEADKKIRAWEQSAKLKGAKAVIDYFRSRSLAVPKKCRHQKIFVQQNEGIICSQRQQYWNRTDHSNRWTGNNLEQDVKKADTLEKTDLEELYQLEYRRMNWFTHGSGLIGTRDLKPTGFMDICGLAYASCGKLALLCAKVCLKAFGYFDKRGIYTGRWETINRNIQMHIAPFLSKTI